MLRVRIGGVTFEGDPIDPGRCFMIEPDGWSGWDDGTTVRREDVSRPGAHGSFGFQGQRDARVIRVSGWILARSPQELQQMRNQLTGVLASGGYGRLSVDQPLGSTWADVMLSDMPVVKVRGHSELEASFQIQFWAPNPRKFGEVRDFAAGVPATHFGNFPATPRLLIGAGAGGYTVTGPGGRVVTVGTAPAGAHEIDFENGGLFLNGVRQTNAIDVYRPWKIPVGIPGVAASISGARSLTQRVPDTYI